MRSRILVADQAIATDLAYLFNGHALPADPVHDGLEALKQLHIGEYGLLVTGLRLPRLPGLALLAEVRRRRWPVAVLVLTGSHLEADREAALELGADEYLLKPPPVPVLLDAVRRLHRGPRPSRNETQPANQPANGPAEALRYRLASETEQRKPGPAAVAG